MQPLSSELQVPFRKTEQKVVVPEVQPGRERLKPFPPRSPCRDVLIQLSPPPHGIITGNRKQHLHFPYFHPVPKAGKHQCPESQSGFSSERGWSPAGFATTQKGQFRTVHQSLHKHKLSTKGVNKDWKVSDYKSVHTLRRNPLLTSWYRDQNASGHQ